MNTPKKVRIAIQCVLVIGALFLIVGPDGNAVPNTTATFLIALGMLAVAAAFQAYEWLASRVPDPQAMHDAIDDAGEPRTEERLSARQRAQFVQAMACVQLHAHLINVENGWWEDRLSYLKAVRATGGELEPMMLTAMLGLSMTELSEAIEAVRKQDRYTWTDITRKDTLVREMAGCIVRLMDASAYLNADLAGAVLEELNHNEKRGYRHGGRAA